MYNLNENETWIIHNNIKMKIWDYYVLFDIWEKVNNNQKENNFYNLLEQSKHQNSIYPARAAAMILQIAKNKYEN